MLRRPCSIWLYEPYKAKMSREDLKRFAYRLRPKRKILVIRDGHFPAKRARLLERLGKLGLIEVVHLRTSIDYYSEDDFQLASETRAVADAVAPYFVPPMLAGSGYGFGDADIENIVEGMSLKLADQYYVRIRLILAVLRACKQDRDSLWEDYAGWAFPSLDRKHLWWMGARRDWPDDFFLMSKSPEFARVPAGGAGFGAFSKHKPTSLLLGSATRQAYLTSAEAIARAENDLGRRFGAVFPIPQAETMAPPRVNQHVFDRSVEFHYNSRDLVMGPAALRVRMPDKIAGYTQLARVNKADPALRPRFGLNREMWFAALLNETVTATNAALGRIAAFYDCIMNHPHFADVQTLICSPSRSQFFVPVVLGMKQRGVETIEYQPFFWSGHPRYEVRDMDLFICSDAATKKVIEKKYLETGRKTTLLMGPSFAMAQFMQEYHAAAPDGRDGPAGQVVGLALQPENEEVFEHACKLARSAGFEIVFRPHPSQSRAQVDARFSQYGRIDEGTLVDFIRDTTLIVTGFSNVALQAALVGKTAICLPVPNQLGLNLADASERIRICENLEDLPRLLEEPAEVIGSVEYRDPIAHWCDIRRSQMREKQPDNQASG